MSIVLLGIEAPTPENYADRLSALLLTRGRRDNFARGDSRARVSRTSRRQSSVAAIMDARSGYGQIDSAAASIRFSQEATSRLSMATKIGGVHRQTARSARTA